MQTALPVLVGLALVLAVVLPPLSFLMYSFRKWRTAPNVSQGVVFRALSFLTLVPLAYNVGYAKQALFLPGGISIEQDWQLGVACMISLVAFLGRRAVPAFMPTPQTALQQT